MFASELRTALRTPKTRRADQRLLMRLEYSNTGRAVLAISLNSRWHAGVFHPTAQSHLRIALPSPLLANTSIPT